MKETITDEKILESLTEEERLEYQRLKGIEDLGKALGKEVPEEVKEKMKQYENKSNEGDEITKITDDLDQGGDTRKIKEKEREIEDRYKILIEQQNLIEQLNDLKGKIKEKEREIAELKSKGMGDSMDEIFEIKERELKLKEELLNLMNRYNSIKTKLEESKKNA